MTTFIFIRHGETLWTQQKRYQGHSDIRLNARGRGDAKRAANMVRAYGIDILYASPLARARETAEIIAGRIQKKPRPDARIREISFGRWEGRTAQQILKDRDPVFRKWCRGIWVTPPDGESRALFQRRVASFLRDCLRRHPGKKVAVVSHGGTIKMMIFELLKLRKISLWSIRVDPGSVSVLTVYRDFTQLVLLNRGSRATEENLKK